MYLAGIWVYTYLIFIGIPRDVSAIYFGMWAQEGQFTYMAGIIRNDNTRCSGAIIGPYHILTAASCVTPATPESIHVTVGTVHLASPRGIDHFVEKIHIHPGFDKSKKIENTDIPRKLKCASKWLLKIWGKKIINHDIAVIELARSLPLGEEVTHLFLPRDPSISEYASIDFCAFGESELYQGRYRLQYTKIDIPTSPLNDLRNGFYAILYPIEARAGYGDLGGPLVAEDTVYGIYLHNGLFEGRIIAIFLDVHYYLRFIEDVLSSQSCKID